MISSIAKMSVGGRPKKYNGRTKFVWPAKKKNRQAKFFSISSPDLLLL